MFFCKSITVFFPVFEFGQRKLAGFHGWTVAGERRRGDGMPAGTLLKYVGAEFALMVSGGVEYSLDAAFVCSGRAAERGIVTLSPFVPALSDYKKEELSNMKKLNTKTGFTLAELLIVVAIIAVLVAISIPVFTAQLERSRENTDLANMRAAKAEILAYALEPSDQYVLNSSGTKVTGNSGKKFEVNDKFGDTITASKFYVYDATTGDLADPAYAATPYGKGTAGGDYKTPAANKVLYVAVDTEGTVVGAWDAVGKGATAPTWNQWNKIYEIKAETTTPQTP